jgi:hypothetical protein
MDSVIPHSKKLKETNGWEISLQATAYTGKTTTE